MTRAPLPHADAVASLRHASRGELRRRISHGHAIAPSQLAGWTYRGTVLGAAAAVEALTWSTFQKVFHRDALTGALLGWNVRLHQDGLAAPSRPQLHQGSPRCVWFYEVIEPRGIAVPQGLDRGLIIDYGRSAYNPCWEPMRAIKDPLVALTPGDPTCLIGMSYAVIGGACVETPTYFALQREHRTTYVPACIAGALATDAVGAASPSPARDKHATSIATRLNALTGNERALADAIFTAIYATTTADLPPRRDVSPAVWEIMAGATAPTFGPGLRAMLHAFNALPLGYAGFHHRFARLPPARQIAFLEVLAADQRYLVRQLLATFKMLGGFGYFDDPAVRERFTA